MTEGVVLKWLSDYRINIQRHKECTEKDKRQRQAKEAVHPPAEMFYHSLNASG